VGVGQVSLSSTFQPISSLFISKLWSNYKSNTNRFRIDSESLYDKMQQFSSSFELSINAPSELWGEPETARQIQEEAEVLIPNIPQQESRIVESAVSFIWNWFQIDSELITKILSR
jgi:hypothetical protein